MRRVRIKTNKMNIKGKLHLKKDAEQVSDSFRKREFVVEYAENPQYPEFIKVELIQANCDQIDNIKVGDEIDVEFNLKGRKWKDPKGEVKYFNSLQAWRVKLLGASESVEPNSFNNTQDEDGADDLPF